MERSVSQKEDLKPMHNFVQKANKRVIKLTELVIDLGLGLGFIFHQLLYATTVGILVLPAIR